MRISTVPWAVLTIGTALAISACYSAPSPEEISASHSAAVATRTADAAQIVTYAPSQEDIDNRVSYIVTSLGDGVDIYDAAGGTVDQTIAASDVLTVPEATPLTVGSRAARATRTS